MRIASNLPLDPSDIKNVQLREGLTGQQLDKCNSMEFRLIDGAGEGYFLFYKTQITTITNQVVTLTITDSYSGDTKDFPVRVLNKFDLLPVAALESYTILHVAEEKYDLKAKTVARNYNLIRRDQIADGDPTVFWEPDDGTQKTLLQILTDIFGGSVTYTAATYTPLECNIQGMDALSAIDLLCSAYGLLWTVENATLKVFSVTAADIPTHQDISDIRSTLLARQMANLEVTFPVVANGTQVNSRVAKQLNYTTQGEYVTSYMPFLPAIYTKTGIFQNESDLTSMVAALQPNFEGILNISDSYYAYHAFKTDVGATKLHFCLTYADYGSGPRTIYDARHYPFLHIPQPYTFDPDKPDTGEVVLALFELTSTLASGIGSTATATVLLSNKTATPSTINVFNTGLGKGYISATGIAIKVVDDDDEVSWWVLEINQFAYLYTVALTSKTHIFSTGGIPGSYADQIGTITYNSPKTLTDYPFSFYTDQVIYNPFNKHGIVGDTLLVAHVEDGYIYTPPGGSPITAYNIILDVLPATARMFNAEYTADVSVGYQPITATKGLGPVGNNSGEIPATANATDLYHLTWNAKSGMDALLSYDFIQDKTVAVVSQHWATRVRAKIKDDECSISGAISTFDVVPLSGLNGLLPTTDLTVQNKYGWKALTKDDELVVYWDQLMQQWMPEGSRRLNSKIEFTINSIDTASTGPYTGKIVANVTIQTASCDLGCLINTSALVVDHSGCIFDLPEEQLIGIWGWASERVALSTEDGAETGELTPCHWAADDRCCELTGGSSGG